MKQYKINIDGVEVIVRRDNDGKFIVPDIFNRGTNLKPALEPITLARKPLDGTVAENCLKWGVGGLNIDASRVGTTDTYSYPNGPGGCQSGDFHYKGRAETPAENNPLGRFPANLILEDCEEVRECFPETGGGKYQVGGTPRKTDGFVCTGSPDRSNAVMNFGDSGNASRFFKSIIYQPKASKADKGEGNTHNTVKPTKLMEYLIKMITPTGGVVLDPFAGSGTTGVAAKRLGYNYILIEKEAEYVEIIKARLSQPEEQQTTMF